MNKKENIIIVGAGVAGEELSEEIQKHFRNRYKIAGFLDDKEDLNFKKVNGIKIIGRISELSRLIKKFKISEVFIAIPSANGSLIREVIKNCEEHKVIFKIVPRLLEIVEGKVKLSKVREIEISDLLGRAIVQSEQSLFKNEFKNKTVLITGAAGSIGSEICRQILSFNPKKLIALDFWESGLYELGLELSDIGGKNDFECIVANIQDKKRIEEIFNSTKPEIIFHAAAYKHVPLMEEFPQEAIKNNVFGTKNIILSAIKFGVKKFVNISTDKAVEPSSIMGATKLLSEKLVTFYNSKGKTKFCSVRFGNVLGSQGSVIPTFKKQIAKGGPVIVTDKQMTRYFMTIPEAVQLVLYAGFLIKDGGEVFMLDMGESIKIDDLARLMIKLSGLSPETDIKIKYSGIRRGEKLHEKLINDTEDKQKTISERIFLIKGKKEAVNIVNVVGKLLRKMDDKKEVVNILRSVAPGINIVR
ncbi:MAG: Polysaccharide biosynthesis protein superfamily [Candidatus Woesebacteria bacterium GW2011_GWB1_39_10]|uniref:Polysaccharide biosynthesis protein superfamily n=2 Tax=Candidatus Woeseibacteriota TaxID=1752722 RepID=A0A0G0LV04_9BACT|nr:MAG: Polysaccharide biosynthesis protein superfamily [Candidatus Woesebacteria bacterium GW2011_GWB1_39_10]KKS90820.1 MAG: Polysaccharide biosynthesis protein superfamily [Candidatus Woesebacteria bacterium GW2011_GWA1_43_12]